jgi:hypothetical protein
MVREMGLSKILGKKTKMLGYFLITISSVLFNNVCEAFNLFFNICSRSSSNWHGGSNIDFWLDLSIVIYITLCSALPKQLTVAGS